MHWNQWYRLKSYFRSALWIVPFFALVLENIAIRLVFGRSVRRNRRGNLRRRY